MSDVLMPFQLDGAEWLAGQRRALLGDPPGVGKTAQLIRAADLIGARRVFTLGPAIGRINWRREFDRWGLVCPEFRNESYDRAAVNANVRAAIRGFKPDVLICDEAHYLKSRAAKRTKAVYGQHCHNTGLAKDVPFVWLATGTPWLNSIDEMWPHLRALWPELIAGSDGPMGYMEFVDRYCEFMPDDYGGIKVLGHKQEARPALRAMLGKIMLRRKAEDVLPQLPALTWGEYVIEADELPAELKALEAHPDIENLRRVVAAAETDSTRALLIDEDPVALATLRRLTGTVKATVVAKLVSEELTNKTYEKTILFTLHNDALQILHGALEKFGVAVIKGGQTEKQRQQQIDDFQNDARKRVALVQLMAGYHTITLTAAAHVDFVEQSWTPDVNVQAVKRAHRNGQKQPVMARSFGLAGSIDESVNRVLVRKARAILELLD